MLVPRLLAHGADLNLVHFVTVDEDGIEDGLNLSGDLELLRAEIDNTAAVAVMIDQLMSAIADGIDLHNDHSMRRALSPLFCLADSSGVAMVGVAHVNKSSASDFMRRLGGSNRCARVNSRLSRQRRLSVTSSVGRARGGDVRGERHRIGGRNGRSSSR